MANDEPIIPIFPYLPTENIGVGYKIIEYTNGALVLERLDPPYYIAPVVIDADGTYRIDRDNVDWLDGKPDNADDILNEKDNHDDLKWFFTNLHKDKS